MKIYQFVFLNCLIPAILISITLIIQSPIYNLSYLRVSTHADMEIFVFSADNKKIKLWLFLPRRHSSITEKTQAAVSKLKVVASRIWVAPGDSEEISVAFSESLCNCIESRALIVLSYIRFRDVFPKFSPQSEEYLRRGQLTVEFILLYRRDSFCPCHCICQVRKDCIEKLVPDNNIQDIIAKDINSYKNVVGIFGRNLAIRS